MLGALAYVVWLVPDLLTTAVGGFALALVLSFPVGFLSRVMRRGLAILFSFLLVVGLFVLAALFLVPFVVEQFVSLVTNVPYIIRALIYLTQKPCISLRLFCQWFALFANSVCKIPAVLSL